MKKVLKYALISLAALSLSSCLKEEIVFDHEQPAFATQDGQILIEAILPTSTAADDAVYICGPFNGGAAAVGNVNWILQKSEEIQGKWGIYLNPATFEAGKTLNDGFWFYSTKGRREVTAKGEEAQHKLDAQTGKRYNVYVTRWASYYDAPAIPIPTHTDSYRVWYINDNEVDAVNLYMYGDENDLGGGWPGIETTGTAMLGEHLWAYFDIPKGDAMGKTEHLIFNVNGGKKQISNDLEPIITFGQTTDFFYALSSDGDGNLTLTGIADIENPGIELYVPSTPLVSLYVSNLTDWENVYLYSANPSEIPTEEAFGAWPGATAVETVNKDGTDYLRFEFEETYLDHFANLIFNNGGDPEEKTLKSAGGIGLNLAADLKLALSGSCFAIVENENVEPYVMSLYVVDNSGWEDLALYAWGDKELFGAWPGAHAAAEVTWNGVTYKRFDFISTDEGLEEHLIFNNGGNGLQFNGPIINMADRIFMTITDTEATINESGELPVYIYIKNNTGWDDIALYAWGDVELFGGWPGAQPVGQVVVNEVEFTAFAFGDSNIGKNVNLIFNNNGGGTQFNGPNVTLGEELFLDVQANSATIIDKPKQITWVDFYVKDETGWDALSVYSWSNDGEFHELFGGWPGTAPKEVVTFNGVQYQHFRFDGDYLGSEENLIFNNNGNGVQLDNFSIAMQESMFITITADGASFSADPRSTYSIYVADNTGWDALSVYGWQSDQPEIFGGWSGAVPVGEVRLAGKVYKQYKISDSFIGQSYNIIFNNAGAGAQYNVMEITIDRNWFFEAGASSATSIDDPGCRFYVEDKTGWDALAMYAWGDVELFGGWPGATPAGTETINGVEYKYFNVAGGLQGKTVHPILNNNGGGAQFNLVETVIGEDVFFSNCTPPAAD